MVNANVKTWSVSAALLCAAVVVSSLLSAPSLGQRRSPDRGADLRTVSKLPSKENRWALIIGVSTYEDSNITPLPGANNDAKALRDALRDYAGFNEKNIILLTTDEPKDRWPTKNNTLRLLGNLSGTVPKDGLLLVAFSGHGIERQNRAFLLATDTPYNDNVRVLERTAISVQDDVKELIRDTGVKQVIILLDACRNDPTSGRSDSDNPLTPAFTRGFNFDLRNSEIEAFATLYATSIGARAYEYAREGKGYFTWAFIEGLRGGAANGQGEVTLGSLVRYVERYVPQQVKIDLGGSKNQRPFSIIEGYKAEELVLAVARNTNSNLKLTLPPATGTGEQIYWREIENRNTIAAYENYLSEYPNGEFARVAKLRLSTLRWKGFKPTAKNFLKYSQVIGFREGLSRAVLEVNDGGGYVRLIDKTGREAFQTRYADLSLFSEGLARAGTTIDGKDRYGYIDKTGKEIIPFKYEILSGDFKEGLAGVYLDGKTGFIDKTGKEVIPIGKYKCISCQFSEGLTAVWDPRSLLRGFIDKKGAEVIPLKYEDSSHFSEGLAEVKLNGKWGFIDKTGREAVPPKYDYTWSFSEGLAAVKLDGKIGFIDKTGREVIPLKFPDENWFWLNFHEGLAAIRINNRVGFIDTTGAFLIPPKYDFAEQFEGGLAKVKLNDRYGYIDKSGKEVIPTKYEEIWCWEFVEGFLGVKLNGRKGFVDVYGNEYFDIQ